MTTDAAHPLGTAPAPAPATATGPATIAVAFSQLLRGLGLSVPTSCTHTFAEALCATGIDDRDATYWAGRATLVRRPEDIAAYDRAFAVFFERLQGHTGAEEAHETLSIALAVDTDDDDADASGSDDDAADAVIELRFSTTEILRHKDFATYSPDELAQAHELMSHLRLVGSPRASLRRGPTRRITANPDNRRTVRAAIRAGGEPIERHFSAPTPRLRRLVLLLDVSGSMEPYARALLRFVHAAVAGRQKVEAFTMGTRLTRITRELTSRDPDPALGAA
ncbi:MAG TPA: VWA domain-containing protein, partial [Ilumatobacteraceae bacterium]|nr:VWA domain-containing protein [Ilumatobacteraceae bacterium]